VQPAGQNGPAMVDRSEGATGGGGGGAGRIRFNTLGTSTISGLLSPVSATTATSFGSLHQTRP
jgi:hypothetical protein